MLIRHPPLACRRAQPRGLAALTVVMVLFFVMALVAAYTNRNLIFEQRISIGTYRSARATDGAEAALNWGMSLLNGGSIDTACRPSTAATDLDYRRQAFVELPEDSHAGEGNYGTPGTDVRPVAGCIVANGQMSCACPSAAVTNPTITPLAGSQGTAFHTTFFMPVLVGSDPKSQQGLVGLAGYACGSLGTGANDCSRSVTAAPQVDGVAGVSNSLGLLSALPLAPKATLTAGGAVSTTGAGVVLVISNRDNSSGKTVMSGGTASSSGQFAGPAGSAGDGKLESVAALSSLANLASPADEAWFQAIFGMDPTTYRNQPATRLMDCNAGCSAAGLATVLSGYPRNPIYIVGDISIDSATALGTTAAPVMLIVAGTLTVAADTPIIGFVYADNLNWQGAGASVNGAVVTRGNFAATATAHLTYDRQVIDTIRLRYGSFVRMPGSWNTRIGYN